ncbi:MAG: pyruvate dehydrogenase (acetyl-transferring) E1 component subunit alpha [SAR324 cluster bacterium]|nr:pyruvate dehydrogenase (acetyl-transferring) E1 component subunit alpha [SAR324 cluster bacterium]
MPPIAVAEKKTNGGNGKAKLLSKKTLTAQQKEAIKQLGRDKLIGMFRAMNLIRSFERRCEQMYQQRKIGGFLHLYMGQEALAGGMLSAIHSDDYVTTSYRDHGIALALGISPNVLMAELFGKVTGVSRGKGGSMHFFSKEYNLLGGHGIVGGQIPIGLGAAFRAKYLGTDQVSLIFLGDGAVNQGSFHECLNMASIWKLPAIFIIENNQYGMGTSVRRSTSVQDMTLKAQGYGMEGITVDGMNLLDCYMVVRDAVKTRRKRPSPLLVEAKTYRYRGHSISDPGTYRAKEEIENYHKVDPILQVRRLLQELDWLDDESAKALEKEVRKEVDDAVTFAEESPLPDPSERERHVYAP